MGTRSPRTEEGLEIASSDNQQDPKFLQRLDHIQANYSASDQDHIDEFWSRVMLEIALHCGVAGALLPLIALHTRRAFIWMFPESYGALLATILFNTLVGALVAALAASFAMLFYKFVLWTFKLQRAFDCEIAMLAGGWAGVGLTYLCFGADALPYEDSPVSINLVCAVCLGVLGGGRASFRFRHLLRGTEHSGGRARSLRFRVRDLLVATAWTSVLLAACRTRIAIVLVAIHLGVALIARGLKIALTDEEPP